MSEKLLVLSTLPDHAVAEQLAAQMVDAGLCACVNISAPVTSVYRWHGQVQTDQEVLLTIKTTRDRYSDLQEALVAAHPYELPEVIAVPITTGLAGYLDWIDQCTQS